MRPPAAQWRFDVWNSHRESMPTALPNIVTRFLYNNNREGSNFNPAWRYASFTSTTDDFGTTLQSAAPMPANCLDPGAACPSGFTCILLREEHRRRHRPPHLVIDRGRRASPRARRDNAM